MPIFVATNVCGRARYGNLLPCKVSQRRPPLTEIRGDFFVMEIWKDVPGFETRYQVSNLGRVKAKSYIRSNGFGYYTTQEKILSPFKEKCGHRKIVLKCNGRILRIKLHRLVAITFIPNPENKPEVDHINTNLDDNRVENLRWVTSSENKLNPITRYRNSIAKRGNQYRKNSVL